MIEKTAKEFFRNPSYPYLLLPVAVEIILEGVFTRIIIDMQSIPRKCRCGIEVEEAA